MITKAKFIVFFSKFVIDMKRIVLLLATILLYIATAVAKDYYIEHVFPRTRQ